MFQSRESLGLLAAVLVVVGMMGFVLFRNTGAAAAPAAADVAVSCAPAQQAVVRQTMTAGTPRVAVECVDSVQAAAFAAGGFRTSPVPVTPALVPAVYSPYEVEPRVVSRPVVRAPRQAAATSAPARVARSTSWQKRALVIGGSAGVGAGVGALAGGKKGALIGAAIGGGGAALVDALKK